MGEDPAGCALASLEELAHALLGQAQREETLAHGWAAVVELTRRLQARTPPSLTATGLPPMPWQWLYLPAYSSPADDPRARTDGPRGSHLVAADGAQLLRSEGGYAVLEIWDPRTRVWADGHRDQPVAELLASAPLLLSERDEAREIAQRLWDALPPGSRAQFDAPDWLGHAPRDDPAPA